MKGDYSILSLLSTGRHVSQPGTNGCKVILSVSVIVLVKPILHIRPLLHLSHQDVTCPRTVNRYDDFDAKLVGVT